MEYRLRLVCFVTNCMYCSQDNREFAHVRRQRQDADGYQYNIINPIAQNKRIIKSISGVSDVVHALLTKAKCIFSRLVKYASISSRGRRFF